MPNLKRVISLAMTASMIFNTVLTVDAATDHVATGNTYYVDTTVSSSGNGLSEAAAFKTIQEAAKTMIAGDTCIISEGIYEETIRPSNSGSDGANITFKAKEGEKVVVSGADTVTGWERLPDTEEFKWASENVYRAYIKPSDELAQTTTPTGETKQLALDVYLQLCDDNGQTYEQQMNQARYPNMKIEVNGSTTSVSGDTYLYDKLAIEHYNEMSDGGITHAILDTEKPYDYWKDATIMYIGGTRGESAVRWTSQTSKILASSGNRIDFTEPLAKEWHRLAGKGSLYYIYDKLEELDMQTEWHYEEKTGYLYLWAPGDKDLTADNAPKVSIKQRKWALDLEDRDYIKVEGIDVFGASANLENANYNTIDDCDFKYVASDPWVDYTYSRGGFGDHGTLSPWWDSTWSDVGVYIGGSHNTLMNSTVENSFGDCITIVGEYNTVKNSIIKNGNSNSTECAPLSVIGNNHDVIGNSIYNGARAALQFNFVEACRLMYNNMYLAGRTTKDLGVAYCYITDGKETEIAYNWVHDNVAKGVGAGIYLDNASSNFSLHHNVTWNTETMEGIFLNSPAVDHKVYNNTLVNAHGGSGSAIGINSPMENVQVYNNLSTNKNIHLGNDQKNNIQLENPCFIGSIFTENEDIDSVYKKVKGNMNLKGSDFAIKTTSEAVDAGIEIEGITDGFSGSAPDVGAYEAGQEPWVAGYDADVSSLGTNTKKIIYPELRRYNNTAKELKFNNKWYYKPIHGGELYRGDWIAAGEKSGTDVNHGDSNNIDVTDDIGATMSLDFSGSSVKVIGIEGPYMGHTKYTLTDLTDDKIVEEVVYDGYAPSRKTLVTTYYKDGLDKNKEYRLELKTLATKNINSTGFAHAIDEVQVYSSESIMEDLAKNEAYDNNFANKSKRAVFRHDW